MTPALKTAPQPGRTNAVRLCRLRCRHGHLSDDGVKICNREFRRCARCRKYTFMIWKEWRWKLCGTCFHALGRKPGRRWRVGG